MTLTTQSICTFAYQAQTVEGQPLSGTIDAASADEAVLQLEAMHLRVIELVPAGEAAKPKALRGDDFIAFNQQLGYLTAAGLPIEQGLRLIAQDMRSGRLSTTVRQIADELDKGVALGAALERHQGQFPSMYGRLIEAGVRANNLPGMLFSLSRHLELVRRMRAMLWRSSAYPLMVMVGVAMIVAFLGWYVLPIFREIFVSFKVQMPVVTEIVMALGKWLPGVAVAFLAIVLAAPLIGLMLRARGLDRKLADVLVLPLPLIGPVLKRSLLVGWCNGLRLGVEAGLDLPTAIKLAGDVCGSPALRDDGLSLIAVLEAGKPFSAAGRGRVLPPVVIAAIGLGIENRSLAQTLQSLTQMYQEQAEMRLGLLPGILLPLLLLLTAVMVGVVIAALVMPLVMLIGAVSGSGGKF